MASLVGFGNHGRDCVAIWKRCKRGWLAVYDDDPDVAPQPDDLVMGRLLVGINDPGARRAVCERFAHLRGTRPLVDPTAVVGKDVELGYGTVIAPMALLFHSVTLGAHTHVNYYASMTRCTIGAYCTIAPNATICGNVDIGHETLIGASATICERTTIGSRVTIGAGAIVPPWSIVPDSVTVTGVWKSNGSR